MRVPLPDRFGRAVLALAVLAGAWRLFTTWHWSWLNDDWVYLGEVETRGLLDYLFQDYSGHLMPGGFLLTWVITKAFPLQFSAATVLTATMAAGSVWVWGRAFRVIFGPRLRVLVPLGLLALSPTLIRPTMWWASATQVLPLQLTTGLCCWAVAAHVRRPTRRSGALVLLAYVSGLVFWEKALLALLPIVALMLLAAQGSVRALVSRHLRLLASLAALSVGYLGLYLALTGSPSSSGSGGDVGSGGPTLLEFWWTTLRNLVAPSLWGGPWGTLPLRTNFLTAPSAPVAGAAISLLVLGIAAACWWRRRAWIPLAMVTVYFVVATTLIHYTFATSRDVGAAWVTSLDDRYVADTLTVAFLAMALMVFPTLLESPGTHTRPMPAWLPRIGWGAAALLAASTLVGNVLAWQRIEPHPGRQWVATVLAEASTAEGIGVVDARPPRDVLEWEFWPDAGWISRMLAPLPDLNLGGPAPSLVRIDAEGHFVEQPVGQAVAAPPGPVPDCGYAVAEQDVDIPLGDNPLFPFVWGVSVETMAGETARMVVSIDGEVDGRRVRSDYPLRVERGLHRHQFEHAGGVERITTRLDGSGPTVCVTALRVGDLAR